MVHQMEQTQHLPKIACLAGLAGVSEKTVHQWINGGVLLPAETSGYEPGIRGRQAAYPVENIHRIEVITWFKISFGKEPSSVLGIEGLKHLLFLFGFSSPEIFKTEKTLISQGADSFKKELSNHDIVLLLKEGSKLNEMDMESCFNYVIKALEPLLGKIYEPVRIFSISIIRWVIKSNPSIVLDFIHSFEDAHKINEAGLKGFQSGLAVLLFMLPFNVGNPKVVDFKSINKSLNDNSDFLRKINLCGMLLNETFSKFVGKKNWEQFMWFLITPKPEMAALLQAIFLTLRTMEDVQNHKLIFTDEEIKTIDSLPYTHSLKNPMALPTSQDV